MPKLLYCAVAFLMSVQLFTAVSAAADVPAAAPGGDAAAASPLPNSGFEDGETMWTLGDEISKVGEEAARTGKKGLRIGTMEYSAMGSSVHSARLPVAPGQEITIGFWAKTTAASSGAYVWYYNASGKMVKDPAIKGGIGSCMAKIADGAWHEYTYKSTVPAEAASVGLWIHSFSGTKGITDYDDFTVGGIAAGAVAIAPPAKRATKPTEASKPAVSRQAPAVIILKFDDVKQVRGQVHGAWQKLANFLEQRKIKGSFGVICETLAEAQPKYVQWIKERREAGYVEFWFHAWDHAVHEKDGKKYNEFTGRSYEEQRKRFDDSQKLAQEKLGFAFTIFGPPGGVMGPSCDAETIKVMADEPNMKGWLYPKPIDADGKKLEAAGKVTILDRVWEVNLEGQVGSPDFQRFVQGYQKHPEREYFVLQGHPAAWAGEKFDEFIRIIEFLEMEKAVFMTPSEYLASRKK